MFQDPQCSQRGLEGVFFFFFEGGGVRSKGSEGCFLFFWGEGSFLKRS